MLYKLIEVKKLTEPENFDRSELVGKIFDFETEPEIGTRFFTREIDAYAHLHTTQVQSIEWEAGIVKVVTKHTAYTFRPAAEGEKPDRQPVDIDKIISLALQCVYMNSYPLKIFTIEELEQLAKKAKENMVKVELRAEYSNFAQGVLVEVYKWPLPGKRDFNNWPMKEDLE